VIAFTALIGLALWARGHSDSLRFGPENIDSLPEARTVVDERRGRLIIELPAITVPPEAMIRTPVYRASVPFDVLLYAFDVEVVDETGRTLPPTRLHHVIVTDADRRGLFVPLPLPIYGASKESSHYVLPRYLVGVPVPAGRRYIAAGMFMNPEPRARRMQVRVVLSFERPGWLFPLFRAYPWTMDVGFPLGGDGGRHDYDIPSGRSCRSWEGSPQIAGTIVGMGGHAHDYATALQLLDATTGDTVWYQVPERDVAGRVLRIPITYFARWYRLGTHITPSHVYRLTVCYDNPLGATIPYGGMGSVAGLFVPDRGVAWPALDRRDAIYRTEINYLLSNMAGMDMAETADHQMRHTRRP
jgi:hypothetical protein